MLTGDIEVQLAACATGRELACRNCALRGRPHCIRLLMAEAVLELADRRVEIHRLAKVQTEAWLGAKELGEPVEPGTPPPCPERFPTLDE